ncbi:acyltransferase [Enterococcus sp. LJL98]
MKFFLRLIYYKLMSFIISSERYAQTYAVEIVKNKGAKVGKQCRFYSTKFSSEPYLIEIGNHVTLAEGVKLITHDGGMWVLRGIDSKYENANIVGKIKIGNNVFVGVDSIILPGVSIGDNTTIAAGSVVTKSFSGNVVIGGVPARVIKSLDSYIESSLSYIVNTKGLNSHEKKRFILEDIDKEKYRTR